MLDAWLSVMQRGGPVMWPLLALSVVSVTLCLERLWFFASVDGRSVWLAARRYASTRRTSQPSQGSDQARDTGSLYGPFLTDLHGNPGDGGIAEAIETHRGRVERFLPTLSTIITAAPMLGVLGTVLGIIESFELLAGASTGTTLGTSGIDPRDVGAGIAEALITTAAGLVVALLTLVPYNWLRGRAASVLGRLEALAISAMPDDKPETERDS